MVVCALFLLHGCATNPDRMPVQEASEAQRLVFGAPEAVRTQFASQIGTCWFGESGPLVGTHTFTMPESQGETEPFVIRIFQIEPEREEAFQVQFYPHNDNTVVATRNLGLPDSLAKELETSVELWLLEPSQCRVGEDGVATDGSWDPRLKQAGAGEGEGQRPPIEENSPEAAADDEIDMHEAELRARGAIE